MGLLCYGGLRSAFGQEALRISLAGEQASAAHRQALESQSGNIRIGRADLWAGAHLGLEFNDNIAYSDQSRQADFIVHPGVNLEGGIPLSEVNSLYLGLDVGYAKYLRYGQYDRLLIAPGSQLGFDVYVKDFHFNLYDLVTISENPVAQGTVSGVGTYNELANTAGLAVDWDLNDVVATVGYSHQNAISTTSYFSYLDRSSESFFARGAFQFSQAFTAGPEASYGLTTYDRQVLNGSQNASVGFFGDWQATSNLRIRPRVGFTYYTFEPIPRHPTPADSSSYFFSLDLTHRLNDFTSIAMESGRQLRLGVNSELIDLWYFHPRVSLKVFEKASLEPHLVFEQGTDSGNSLFVANERYTLFGGGLSTSYPLMERLTVSLSYDYVVKQSDIPARNYHENRIVVDLRFAF